MGFTEAVKTVFSKYATFSGRATRSEFWWFYLFNIIVTWGVMLAFAIIGLIFNGIEGFFAGYSIGNVIAIIYSLAVLIPNIAVTIRRLHDANHSGWNCLWPLAFGIGAIVLLIFVLQDSYPADNEYGPYEA